MHTLLTWTTPLAPSSDSPSIHLSGCPAPLFHHCPAGHLFLISPWPGEPGPAGEGCGRQPPSVSSGLGLVFPTRAQLALRSAWVGGCGAVLLCVRLGWRRIASDYSRSSLPICRHFRPSSSFRGPPLPPLESWVPRMGGGDGR